MFYHGVDKKRNGSRGNPEYVNSVVHIICTQKIRLSDFWSHQIIKCSCKQHNLISFIR